MATSSCKQKEEVTGMKKDVTTSLGCHPMYNTTFKVKVVVAYWKAKEVMQKIKHTLGEGLFL